MASKTVYGDPINETTVFVRRFNPLGKFNEYHLCDRDGNCFDKTPYRSDYRTLEMMYEQFGSNWAVVQ